jgi:hypothetical protein
MNLDYERLSNNALCQRGTLNARARDEALRILRGRGAWGSVRFLEDYNVFVERGRENKKDDWFWRHMQPAPADSWLGGHTCMDCGGRTQRRGPAGWQCEFCGQNALFRTNRRIAMRKQQQAKAEAEVAAR